MRAARDATPGGDPATSAAASAVAGAPSDRAGPIDSSHLRATRVLTGRFVSVTVSVIDLDFRFFGASGATASGASATPPQEAACQDRQAACASVGSASRHLARADAIIVLSLFLYLSPSVSMVWLAKSSSASHTTCLCASKSLGARGEEPMPNRKPASAAASVAAEGVPSVSARVPASTQSLERSASRNGCVSSECSSRSGSSASCAFAHAGHFRDHAGKPSAGVADAGDVFGKKSLDDRSNAVGGKRVRGGFRRL